LRNIWPPRMSNFVVLSSATFGAIDCIRHPKIYPRHTGTFALCAWMMLLGAMLRHWEE
jgi:hypothetical protein